MQAPTSELLFGLMLVAAIVGASGARALHVPRVVGLLIAGMALRGALLWLYRNAGSANVVEQLDAAAEPLEAIRDLALGLILFTIGGVFERTRFRNAGSRLLRISACEIALTAVLVFAGCLLAGVLLPGADVRESVVLAVLLGLAAIATAPAATLFVLQEYEAKGPRTATILGLTGVNNVACIVLFYCGFLVLTFSGLLTTSPALVGHLAGALVLVTLGSVVLGVVCGTLISVIHARLSLSETLLVFFAMYLLLGAGEKWLLQHDLPAFNFLLTSLVIGAIFANVAIDADKLSRAVDMVGVPVYAGFFVMAGYGLHLDELAHMGVLGAVYIICRLAGKVWGCRLGARWAHDPRESAERVGSALLCQAAVVIGLADFVSEQWLSGAGDGAAAHGAEAFVTIILGSVVVFELIGPLLVKRCVVQGGEVKAITLLGRTEGRRGLEAVLRITLHSLMRLVLPVGRARRDGAEEMSVQHIMRTNVRLLPASVGFGEVLHFIERSSHHDFPVVSDEGELVGMLRFRDIRDVIYDPMLRDLVTAMDLADAEATVVPMTMPLSAVLEVFARENVSVLPVVREVGSRRVVGIVEQRDLLRALHRE